MVAEGIIEEASALKIDQEAKSANLPFVTYLNEKGIKTARGNTWKNTQVFSVLKKYRQRLDRIKNVRQFDHGLEIGKFELTWIRDF